MRILRLLMLSTLVVAAAAWAKGPVYTIGVDGLACPFCAYGIEKQLQKLDGVAQLDTDIGKGQIVIQMEEGRTLDKGEVVQAVKKTGFSLRSFEQNEAEATP
jgi:copper chaperone CopZ